MLVMRGGCRAGAAGAAALQGRQAQRGGDSPQGFPLECKRSAQRRRREGIGTGRSRKKWRVTPKGNAPGGCAISAPPAPPSSATARSRQVQRTRMAGRPRSAR
ncbi:hypothetical protein EA660_05685 [Pseudoxanthomonas winnipegensis]|uniref:Uncharacterized protein n=1 Tax=Pseudoxanthomonas winnipegensis TaxID=2480810 RepID=A0A4V2HDC8_9GAMM|nr:hypothetical protein EA660_05685 [Pseudoxanthomonas winnipegensis]